MRIYDVWVRTHDQEPGGFSDQDAGIEEISPTKRLQLGNVQSC